MKTLFLDRDGVINIEKDGSYIFSVEEFTTYPGALEAIATAKKHFDIILVVTNQRGIGRGLMTEKDLNAIHEHLQKELEKLDAKIDKFYFAPATNNDHPDRKPNIGMALQAKQDFPEIDFSNAVMIGNNISDMQFGKNIGMKTVFLHTTKPPQILPHDLIDTQYDSLKTWSEQL